MPPHPQVFPPLSEGAIASYDYYDFASSVGYKTFYPADFSGATYSLVTETIYSHAGYTAGECDLDFDIEFKRACDIKGDVIINIPCARYNPSGSPATIGYTATVYIRHWDGTTETELGNAVATQSDSIGTVTWHYKMNALKVTVADTHFAAGETLRVTVVFVQTGAERVYLGHDPKGRTFTNWTYGTQMRVDVPFRLNN